MAFMENLDNDVLENILFRLPFGGASLQARRVCRLWKKILADKRRNKVGFLFACCDYDKIKLFFGKDYDHIDCNMIDRSYSNERPREMEHGRFSLRTYHHDFLVGSCNGLLCFQKADHDRVWLAEPFAICNPLTGEIIFLKVNSSSVLDEPDLVSSGFGYCHLTDEYKVVSIYRINSPHRSHVRVYTIGSNKWRDIETYMNCTFLADGIFANGVLNWLNYDEDGIHIVAFDLEDEKFRELPPPPAEAYKEGYELKLLGGNLCWINWAYTGVDIWAYKRINTAYGKEEYDLKRNYYNQSSWKWVKDFSIECDHPYYKLFAITKCNQVLMLKGGKLCCYDPNTQTISKLVNDIFSLGCSKVQAIRHANSYVSLKDFGETWYARYGPVCSSVPQTKHYVSLTQVRDTYDDSHKTNRRC